MTTDSFFALMCSAIIALFFGMVMTFAGYRFFRIILPIWGFFFGFGLGAQMIQAIFGTGFLSDITSWIVGFIVAVAFAVVSYLFYTAAIAILAGSLGYSLGAGLVLAIFSNLNFIAFLVGVVVAVIFAIAVLVLNIQNWVVYIATALIGAGTIIGTFLFIVGGLPSSQLVANPVVFVLQNQPFWLIIFILVAALGVFAQWQTSRYAKIESYNRWDEMTSTTSTT